MAVLIGIVVMIMGATILLFRSIATRISYSKEQIIEIAEAEIDGSVVEIEVDHQLFHTYYEMTIVDEYTNETEVVIDASDGTILKIEQDD